MSTVPNWWRVVVVGLVVIAAVLEFTGHNGLVVGATLVAALHQPENR